MKELYIAPELKLVSFVPAEKLAADYEVDFGGMGDGNWNPANPESSDLFLDF